MSEGILKLALPSVGEDARLADLYDSRQQQFGQLERDVAAGKITRETSMLRRKALMEASSPGNPANMPLGRRMAHKFQPVKQFFSGPKGKMRGLGILGGLGALGYLWHRGKETPEEKMRGLEEPMAQEPYSYEEPYYAQGAGTLGKYSASTSWAFSAEVPNTPTPVKMPKNPGAPNSLALAHDVDAGKEPGRTDTATGGGAMGGESSKLGFLDEGVAPIAGGAAGGLGGYLLGSKVVAPLAANKADDIERRIAKGVKAKDMLRKVQGRAPLTAAAIGAILLAGLASRTSRKRTKERMAEPGAAAEGVAAQYGYHPNEEYNIRDPRARMY